MVPAGVEVLQAAARVNDPDAVVSRGDPTLPSEQQSVRILGTPLGHPGFVRSSWLICLRDMVNCWRRSSPSRIFSALGCSSCVAAVLVPTASLEWSTLHDAFHSRCPSRLLGVVPANNFWDLVSLPLSLGGLCLRSATLLS